MRRISFKWIVELSGGVLGLIIILLGWDSLAVLLPAFLKLLIDHPQVAGFLWFLGLIMPIHSAKQKYQIRRFTAPDHTDWGTTFESTVSFTIPVGGWLNKIETSVFQSIALNNNDVLLGVAWHNDVQIRTQEGATDNETYLFGAIDKWITVDSVMEFQTTFPIHFFYLDNLVPDNDSGSLARTTKLGGPGQYYEQGDLIFASIAAREIGGMTAGELSIVTTATIIVACLHGGRGGDRDEQAPYVYMLFEGLGSTVVAWSWPCNTNMRIANIRATLWNGMTNATQPFLAIGKNVSNLDFGNDDLDPGHWLVMEGFTTELDPAGTEFTPSVTQYSRGPFYMKKGESVQTRMDDIPGWGMIEFQYLPNFGYLSEFLRRIEFADLGTNTTNQMLAVFTVPYDMFITSIEGSISLVMSADILSNIYILGIKQHNLLDSNDLLSGYVGANVDGNILGADNQAGAMPWALKQIPVVGDVSSSTHFVSKFGESIADYYPAGSIIGVWIPDDFPDDLVTLFEMDLQVEGLNRIKTKTVGTNFLSGDVVMPLEMTN